MVGVRGTHTYFLITSLIQQETNVCPQVIVLEHADDLKLKSHDFESFVIKRWRKGGEKLI